MTIEMLKKGIIDEAVATKWGDASVTKAIIALLRAAYKDPNNKSFVYSPRVVSHYPLLSRK